MPTLEEMRAEINRLLPDVQTPNFLKTAQTPFHMPGVAEAAATFGSSLAAFVPAHLYGFAKGIQSGEYGQSTKVAQEQAAKALEARTYKPRTEAGQSMVESIEAIPRKLTGSHMGVGPMAEIWKAPMRISPSDVQVMGARGINAAREIGNISRDFSAAQSGLTRLNAYNEPTYGAKMQNVAQDIGDVMARRQAMRSEEGAPVLSGFGTFTDLVPDPRMYAVKPKGGNWPTTLGSTLPLKEQGKLGEYLSKVQYDDPVAVFENQLGKHFPRGIDNRQLLHDWEDYLKDYYLNNANGIKYSDLNGPAMQQLRKEAADKFAKEYNAGTIGSENLPEMDKKLYGASQIEQTLPAYNAWVMGPFQKYITNQMGTGLATDPLLQVINEGAMPLQEIFGVSPVDEFTERQAQRRREDFQDKLFGWSSSPEKRAAIENSIIGKQTATTPEGIDYEKALDAALYAKGPFAFRDQFPAVSKLNENALITDFLTENPSEQTGFKKIRSKVFTDLLSGKLDPNKLSNVTPATITQQIIKDKMAEFKAAQLSKQAAADWIPKRAAAMPTDMAFPDGSKMTIITPEMANADEAMTARDLGQITIDLNQCTGSGCHATQDYPGHGPYLVPHTGKPPRGKVEYDKYGYLRRLKEGSLEIASLKDPNGLSQATIELRLEKPQPIKSSQKEFAVGVWLEDNKTPEDVREFYNNKVKHGIDVATVMAVEKFPELQTRLDNYNGGIKKSVLQMKGKDNGDIEKTYVPHVVQWLNQNADKLTDVRDLQNLPSVQDLNSSYDSIGKMMDKNQHWYSPTVEQFFQTMENEKGLPRFFTNEEFALKATERGVDLSAEPKRAEGEESKYPEGATNFQKDMIDYFQPGAIRKSYGGYDRIISYDPETNTVIASEVKRDPDTGEWIDHPTYGGPRSHSTMPSPEEFRVAMGRPRRSTENEQFARLTELQADVLEQNMDDYFNNNLLVAPADMVEPYATDMRILMGSQNPDATLSRMVHENVVTLLLDQDNHTADIRDLMNRLERGNYFVTGAQAENLLNILISWTERYPLNE